MSRSAILVACAAIIAVLALLSIFYPSLRRIAMDSGSSALSEKRIDALFQGSPDQQKEATNYVLQHPDAVAPLSYIYVVRTLWSEGNRSQAAFWFYLFQSRTGAWFNADTTGSGYAALRAALNDEASQTINGWVASDLGAWHDIASRAISYEAKIPLYAGKPDSVSESEWQKLVSDARTQYEAGFKEAFAGTQADEKKYLDERAANGMYVGPLKDPGEPLPESWR